MNLDNPGRINEEFEQCLESDELQQCGIDVTKKKYSINEWKVGFVAPDTSYYHGGFFKLSIVFPKEYPTVKPIIKFVTKIFHPNVKEEDGSICIDILNQWDSSQTIENALINIYTLLIIPNPLSYLNERAANLLKDKKDEFKAEANRYVREYAAP